MPRLMFAAVHETGRKRSVPQDLGTWGPCADAATAMPVDDRVEGLASVAKRPRSTGLLLPASKDPVAAWLKLRAEAPKSSEPPRSALPCRAARRKLLAGTVFLASEIAVCHRCHHPQSPGHCRANPGNRASCGSRVKYRYRSAIDACDQTCPKSDAGSRPRRRQLPLRRCSRSSLVGRDAGAALLVLPLPP